MKQQLLLGLQDFALRMKAMCEVSSVGAVVHLPKPQSPRLRVEEVRNSQDILFDDLSADQHLRQMLGLAKPNKLSLCHLAMGQNLRICKQPYRAVFLEGFSWVFTGIPGFDPFPFGCLQKAGDNPPKLPW